MTWYQNSLFQPVGPVAQSSSPGNIGGGYSDLYGGLWGVDPSSRVVPPSISNPWQKPLARATSIDSAVDNRAIIRFTYQSGTLSQFYNALRLFYTTLATDNCYLVGVVNGAIVMYRITGGNLAATMITTAISGLVSGSDYDIDMNCVQTNGTTTTITGTVYSVSSAGSALGSGTQIGTTSTTDTTSAMQNQAGVVALCPYQASGVACYIKQVATFTDVAPSTATALVVAGPANAYSGQAANNFVVTANGTLASGITVTPTDGAGGTFSPASITLAAGTFPTAAFTYTPASTGSKSVTASGGTLSSNTQTVAVTTAPTAVPVTSPAFYFSPANWSGDTGRAGSVYRRSWNNGAYFRFVWAASASPTAQVNFPVSPGTNMVSYFINGTQYDNLAANGPLTISGVIPSATNTLELILRNSSQTNRWNGGDDSLQVFSMLLDAASTPGTASFSTPWVLGIGDSITEGIYANGVGNDDHLFCYTFLTRRALNNLGYEYCNSACGNSGYLTLGDNGDVPAYYSVTSGVYSEALSRWDKIDQGISLLDGNGQISAFGSTGTPPAAIFINYGTNEYLQSKSTSDLQAAVTMCMTSLRAAAPLAKIIPLIPFGLQYLTKYSNTAYVAAIRAGFAAYQSANPGDTNVQLLDLGKSFAYTIQSPNYISSDLIHPNQAGHAITAPQVTAAIVQALAPAAGRSASFS